jgi:hypothetical protein
VDEHGLGRSRPGEEATLAALKSQDNPIGTDEHATHRNRKRKGASSASPLEWMPPQGYPDAVMSPTEPLVYWPSKRPRRDTPVICPAVLSFDARKSSNQFAPHRLDSVILHVTSPLGNNDSEGMHLGIEPQPDVYRTIDDVVVTIDTENFDDGSSFGNLRDQYIRSPTTSPPPDNTASELSGTMLAAGKQRLPDESESDHDSIARLRSGDSRVIDSLHNHDDDVLFSQLIRFPSPDGPDGSASKHAQAAIDINESTSPLTPDFSETGSSHRDSEPRQHPDASKGTPRRPRICLRVEPLKTKIRLLVSAPKRSEPSKRFRPPKKCKGNRQRQPHKLTSARRR